MKTTNFETITYFDPETLLFNNLDELFNQYKNYHYILFPIFCNRSTFIQSLCDIEIHDLQKSLFNEGFISIRKSSKGISISEWISDVILNYTTSFINKKIITFNRIIDLLPYFFSDGLISQDKGYAVSPLNISERDITENHEKSFSIDGYPLYFFHYYGFDTGVGRLSKQYFRKDNQTISKLWDIYNNKLNQYHMIKSKYSDCILNYFDNQQLITNDMRLMYRKRLELQEIYPFPRITIKSNDNFFDYVQKVNSGISQKFSFFKKFKTLLRILYKHFKFKLSGKN
jgi:hypothetical protein